MRWIGLSGKRAVQISPPHAEPDLRAIYEHIAYE